LKYYPTGYLENNDKELIQRIKDLESIREVFPEQYRVHIKDLTNQIRVAHDVTCVILMSTGTKKDGEEMAFIFVYEDIESKEDNFYDAQMDTELNLPYFEIKEDESSSK